MKNNNKIKIKTLSITLIVYGSAKLLLDIKGIWWAIKYTFYSSNITFLSILHSVGLPLLFNFLIPVAIIAGGVGLYQKKKWGWVLTIIISLSSFTFHCSETIIFIIASYFYRNIPIQPILKGENVVYVSMIPTYVITVISLTYILVLNHKSVKNDFIKSNVIR
jgi:hypothetical protein